MAEEARCSWCGTDPLYVAYHDTEWGVPEHDNAALFEKLLLDGFQAGLSWITILRKREAFRTAFDHFDAERIARFDARHIERLMQNAGIVRNRAKITGAVASAKAYLALREAGSSFSEHLWQFVGGKPQRNRRRMGEQLPAQSPESLAMSRNLKKHGFSFVGPTICYAFMQAVGMVNDHVVTCPRYKEVAKTSAR